MRAGGAGGATPLANAPLHQLAASPPSGLATAGSTAPSAAASSVPAVSTAASNYLSQLLGSLKGKSGGSDALGDVLRGDIAGLEAFEPAPAQEATTATTTMASSAEAGRPSLDADAGVLGQGGAISGGSIGNQEAHGQAGDHPLLSSMESQLHAWEQARQQAVKQEETAVTTGSSPAFMSRDPPVVAQPVSYGLAGAVAPSVPAWQQQQQQQQQATVEQQRLAGVLSSPRQVDSEELSIEQGNGAALTAGADCQQLTGAYFGHPVLLESACSKSPKCRYDFGRQACVSSR